MKKILLALQFYKGDQARAYQLARFIVEQQKTPSPLADFCFVPRFDTPHDRGMNAVMSKKFPTFVHHGRRKAVGWPHGCNDLWLDFMARLSEKNGLGYKAVLTFEADCMPLTFDWIEKLHAEWDAANATTPVCVVGALSPTRRLDGTPITHCNGNALFSCAPEFLKWVSAQKIPPKEGWDTVLANDFCARGWGASKAIRSDWHSKAITGKHLDNFLKDGVVLHHGCKDLSLYDVVVSRQRTKRSETPAYVRPAPADHPRPQGKTKAARVRGKEQQRLDAINP